MKLHDISVRHRLLLNNLIMILVPIMLMVALGSAVFYGLRATGEFREREMELLWPEAGDAASVHLALSHLRAHVDWSWKKRSGPGSLRRHVAPLEERGVSVAVIDYGEPVYETSPGTADTLRRVVLAHDPDGTGNVMLWDSTGLYVRYTAPDSPAEALAYGPLPFQVEQGFFPPDIERTLRTLGFIVFGFMTLIIIIAGVLLARQLSHELVVPLRRLQQAAGRIGAGDYEAPIPLERRDELGDTARSFEAMRVQLRADRDLRQSYEQSRQELIAGIAHDLRTPLTKITGYTSGLLDGIANTEEKRQHYLELVLHNAESMQALVQNLFLHSKLELGEAAFQWEELDLAAFLRDYVSLQAPSLAEQQFTLSFHDERPVPDQPATVRLDRLQFNRVLDNILGNSLKYRSGTSDCLDITLTASADGYELRLADTGSGVADADLPRLFDSFYRTDKARTGVAQGSGLGLAIAKHIVTDCHGTITAAANHPHGLAIIITLPAA